MRTIKFFLPCSHCYVLCSGVVEPPWSLCAANVAAYCFQGKLHLYNYEAQIIEQ